MYPAIKHRLTVELDAKALGRAIAHTDDEAQAEIINTLGEELRTCCSGNDGMQLCCITRHLNKNGISVIKHLAEFIRLREEDPNG